MHTPRLLIVVVLLAVGCTSAETSTTTSRPTAPAPTDPEPTTLPAPTASTAQGATSTVAPSTTSKTPEPQYPYAVIAEERSRRLAVIDPLSACEGCPLEPVLLVELPERPHNLTAIGSVVYATHPAAGSVSRVDVATGASLTVTVGVEPHDIKPVGAPGEELLYVADEAGRRLLHLDPTTLQVIESIELPAQPHDLAVSGGVVWITLMGRDELARVEDGRIDLFATGGSPHDLIIDQEGKIWFSNWNSDTLSVFDPGLGSSLEAPAGVSEPHHFAIGPDSTIWVSDNGGDSIVGFLDNGPLSVEVGPTPHHLAFVGDTLVVAVSGIGEAVLVRDGAVYARVPLTAGLHGVAVVSLAEELRLGQ